MKAVAEILERAAALIEPEGAWTQGVLGRDAEGRILMGYNLDRAVCFCAEGAIRRVAGKKPVNAAFSAVQKVIRYNAIGYWNDRPQRTQKQVVAALRKAAALARGEQP